MENRTVVLVGEVELGAEDAETLVGSIETMIEGRKPLLVTANDSAAICVSEQLAQALGVKPVICAQWNQRSSHEDDSAYLWRVKERLRLPMSQTEVVCVSSGTIETALEIIGHRQVQRNVVLAVIDVGGSVKATAELKGKCRGPLYTDVRNLIEMCPKPGRMESALRKMNKLVAKQMSQAFLSVLSAYTETVGPGTAFAFSPLIGLLDEKSQSLKRDLLSLESSLAQNYSSRLSQLRLSLRAISASRAQQEDLMREIVNSFYVLRSRIDRYLHISSELRAEIASLQSPLAKSPAVLIKFTSVSEQESLTITIRLLKHVASSYQVSYFPPLKVLGVVKLEPSTEDLKVRLTSISEIPPGEYEIFLHKESNASKVKSNRLSFSINLPDSRTPMD